MSGFDRREQMSETRADASPAVQTLDRADARVVTPACTASPSSTPAGKAPVTEPFGGCGCGAAQADTMRRVTPAYVYALGRIDPRFPTLAAEKEFAQAAGRSDTGGLTDRQTLHAVLSHRENRYLARQVCWVFTIEGLDTYILHPRDSADLDLLVETLRDSPSPLDVDVVVGRRGPLAPPDVCNGLMVPIVAFDQLYAFDRQAFIDGLPRPDKVPAKQFGAVAAELFDRIVQLADNAGATDAHRAVNYVVLRYPAVHALAAERAAQESFLAAVEVHDSPLSGSRRIVEVIFAYTNRRTDVTDKFFVRVDVTEQFPFLVTKLSSYYDR
jgi:hypothetical protein